MRYYYLKRHKGIFYYLQNGKRKYGYRLTYYDQSHKRHEKSKRGFANLVIAIRAYQHEESLAKASRVNTITVAQWCDFFLEHMIKPNVGTGTNNKAISTYTSYKEELDHNVIPLIGNLPLYKLKPTVYRRKCLNVLVDKKQLAHKTVMNINTCFKTALNYAVTHGNLAQNPIAGVKPAREHVSPEREQMNTKELHKFNHELAKHSLTDKVIFITLERTGMRIGELLGLRWKDIDFKQGTISVKHTRDNNGVRPPKTKSSIRILQGDRNLIHLLKQYYTVSKTKYHITRKSFIIQSSRGNPITPSLVPMKLHSLLKKSGLSYKIGRFTLHSFRHMVATELISDGVNVVDVAKYLGHSNPDTTLKFYARALPGKTKNLGSIMEKLDK